MPNARRDLLQRAGRGRHGTTIWYRRMNRHDDVAASPRSWFITRSHTTVETVELKAPTRGEAKAAFFRGEGENRKQEVVTDWVWTGGSPLTEEVGDGLD